ncbi:MAG: mechanosensitive ion channel family protein [Methanoregulaceae archaeon]|nr:mechanosensitive ion channel family protein [Methanoregulaceae archaeon]
MQTTNSTLDIAAIVANVKAYDIIAIAVILIIAVIIAKIVTTFLKKKLSDRMEKSDLKVVNSIVWWSIILIGIFFASPHFKIDLSGLLVAGGILAVIIGFASQSVVSNFVSGIFLIIERPMKIGDNINIGDVTGNVEHIQILSTIVRTFEGIYVRVPNEKVFTSNISNYVSNVARRFDYRIGISYRDDANRAIMIIRDIIEQEPFALKNPEPLVFADKLGDSSVELLIRIWAPSKEWYDLKMSLLVKIKTTLEANGIEIPYPQQVVWVQQSQSGGRGRNHQENAR